MSFVNNIHICNPSSDKSFTTLCLAMSINGWKWLEMAGMAGMAGNGLTLMKMDGMPEMAGHG